MSPPSFRRINACAVFVCGCLLASVASSQTVGPTTAALPQIVTTGVGEMHIAPDRAMISIGVQSRATTASQAGADNARRQRAIVDTLKALGVAADQLSTNNYSVYPEMSSMSTTAAPRISGYIVTNTVRVDVHRLEDVGRLIDAALAKGANEMSSLQFYSSKLDSARHVALAAAVANARDDAEVVARAGRGKLGALILIASDEVPSPQPMPMARMALTAPTSVQPGQETITALVTARWLFIPNP